MGYGLMYVVLQKLYDFVFAFCVIFITYVGGYGKSGRDGDADEVHLCQVGAFTAK
jgi:hypothetical protein